MTVVPSIALVGQVFAFLLGCCLGSFYNVVIYRVPLKQSIVRPGSHCPRCGKGIAAYDNIPVLSFLLLGGKCRHCGARISLRYPLVEVVSGLFAFLLFRRYGVHPQFVIEFVFVSLLLIIAFIDLDTFLIPDVLSWPGILLGFVSSFFTPRLAWTDSLLGIVIGGGLFYLIGIGFMRIRHKEGLGGGDVFLLAMIGAFLGWHGVLFTILVSSVTGMIIAVPFMLRSGKGLGLAIPYGPFLAFGAVCYVFWGRLFYEWYFSDLLGM